MTVALGPAPSHVPALLRTPGDGADAAANGATLCRACGMCCNGAMYAYVSLTDGEAARLRTRLPVFQTARETDHDFSLPCSLHGPEGCTIYEDRPATCASYSCFLLDRVQSGRLPLRSALRSVTELRASIAGLERVLPPGDSLWDRAAVARAAAPPLGEAPRARHVALLLELERLEERLRDEVDDRMPIASEA